MDPYNYLRALFRGEVILTSDKLPTFASPRVWGMTTASTLGARGSYTTRSPQGFSPIRKKPATTTTTPAPFFAQLGLSSKGEENAIEKKIPLPVGMLGTPTPSYKNLKTLLLSRGQAVQGSKLLTPRNKLLTPRRDLLPQPTRQPTKAFSQTVRPTKGQTFMTSSKEVNGVLETDSIEEMLKKILQKNNPSFAAVPAVPQRSAPKEFPVLEAVPTKAPTRAPTRMPTRTPTRMPVTSFPTKRLLVPTKSTTKAPMMSQTFFSPPPAPYPSPSMVFLRVGFCPSMMTPPPPPPSAESPTPPIPANSSALEGSAMFCPLFINVEPMVPLLPLLPPLP